MIILSILRTFAFIVAATSVFFVGTALLLPFAIIYRHRAFQWAAKRWAWMLLIISGSKITISGMENIPKTGGLIVASNHQGAFDILIHLAIMPRGFRFVAKKELFKIPLFGWYMTLAGYVPIDREVSASAHRTIGGVTDVLKSGDAILIFPEGTRSKTGEIGPFKRGSLMAAFQSGAPVLPVCIQGSFEMLPRNTFLIRPSKLKVSFGKPISFEKYKDKKPLREDYEKELAYLRDEIIKLS